jgi:DNA helicase HerA-like ATPase
MADPAPPADDFATRIAAGYATDGVAIEIGRAVLDGTAYPESVVQVPIAMCNRHGLIAGATGTGKTVTLQLLAEQLSARGVAVFAADIKGDLSGLVKPAEPGDKIKARIDELQLSYTPTGAPVQFWALGGQGPGVPVRAPIGSFGPTLLAKVLGANETQTSSLALVFHYADQKGLPLLDLVDLTDLLKYLVGDEGKAELKSIGGLSSQTAGVLLRKMVELEQQDAELFFGEPEVAIDHLIRTAPDGRGVINCLELSAVQDRPKLFSTFLMWMLANLFEHLPEVGDLDQPKLVFFFDEAHLLFNDASKDFIDEVAQTVRLIRSKGVGVFFVTQLPDDVPDDVLAQLGNRFQHALRAYTPRDAKALKAAVSTYPKTADYDLEEALTQLGIGEAVVTTLTAKGVPTPVAWTRVRPPQSQIGAVDPAEVKAMAEASDLWPTYATEVDRRSARELLAERMGVTPAGEPAPAAPGSPPVVRPDLPPPPATAYPSPADPSPGDLVRDSVPEEEPEHRPRKSRSTSRSSGSGKDDGNAVPDFLKSREGRSTVNTVLRGVFSLLKKRR